MTKINKEDLPSKISNLYSLRDKGFEVPIFYVLNEKNIENIENEINEIIRFFKNNSVKKIIIRSAGLSEDQKDKSLAGFFESSDKIQLDELKTKDIQKIWEINSRKASGKDLFLFIQEFCEFDNSGVLFTQNIYNDSEAVLKLSKTSFGITSGGTADETFIYDKESKQWLSSNKDALSAEIKNQLEKLISSLDKDFAQGADVELGIKNNKLIIVQARPITRNEDEKILLPERKRLVSLFGKDFKEQVWIQNNLTSSLGDLTLVSVNFYNSLLCSKELNKLLANSKFTDKKSSETKTLRILENIGGRTYYNTIQAEKVFSKNNSFLSNLKNAFLIGIFEPFVRKENEEAKKKKKEMCQSFSWLFLAGIYFQFFLEYDKKLYGKDFNERLRNTEKLSDATQPFFRKESELDDFVKNFYYLSDCPYELTSLRIKEMSRSELMEKYFNNNFAEEKTEVNKFLSNKSAYWLKQKNYWKKDFLKILYEKKNDLVEEYETRNEHKIKNAYEKITASNFPFSKETYNNNESYKEVIVVPGKIDREDLFLVTEDDDILKYQEKCIAIKKFPNYWIAYIPKLKGIITEEGNELSHTAITCREYGIPYLISAEYFKIRKQ